MTPISADQLCVEILATFPNMVARPAPEYRYCCPPGCVVFGGEGEMPDGLPVTADYMTHSLVYDGPMHNGLAQWLQRRGFAWERINGDAFLAIPIDAGTPT